jgi:hypothetical protein
MTKGIPDKWGEKEVSLSNPQLRRGNIRFLLAQVRDDQLDAIPSSVGRVVEIVIGNGGTVTTICSSLVVSTFGFPFEGRHSEPTEVAQFLLAELSSRVRILHGKSHGLYGGVGSATCLHYGPILPNLEGLLTGLSQVEFGQSREIIREI